jgi:hypothetical protein
MTLDIRTDVNHNGKWQCMGCHTWNDGDKPRCGWCSKPNPGVQAASPIDDKHARLTQMLHQAVERMSYSQKVKTWNLLENNVL